MSSIEKKISNLISSQFPNIIQENGENFVEFLKAYYEWLEENNNSLYHSRRLIEYGDIDDTIDEFIIHFKNKYLNNIQFETVSSTRNMVKHSLDLYRSKGTERSIDLFFRNVFGVPANIYYPGKDMFKPSSAKWFVPKYLEISYTEDMNDFIGVQIEGLNSHATAFVEAFVKNKISSSGKYNYVLYVSNIKGNFVSGEKFKSIATGQIGSFILGSVNEINVISGGFGYNVGDLVNVYSESLGAGAKARVSSLANTSGTVNFNLINGGWGYNANSEVIISNNVLTISNVNTSETTGTTIFNQFETIVQPTLNVYYTSLTGNSFSIDDIVYRIEESTNTIFSFGTVISQSTISNTAGRITISVSNGSFSGEFFMHSENNTDILTENGLNIGFEDQSLDTNRYIFKFANSLNTNTFISRAVMTDYIDESATANVMKLSDIINITINNSIERFASDEIIYQINDEDNEIANGIINGITYSGSNASITLTNVLGVFNEGPVFSKNSAANGNLNSISSLVGVIDISGNFRTGSNNLIYGLNSQTSGTLTRISTGFGANIRLSPTFLYNKIYLLNNNLIGDYATTFLNSPNYNFPANGIENSNTVIIEALTYANINFGKISNIILSNPGVNYDSTPMIIIYDKNNASLNKKDFIVDYSNSDGTYNVSEVILQNGIEVGVVKPQSNSTFLYLERITKDEILIPIGTETLEELEEFYLIGSSSGTRSLPNEILIDELSIPIGLNANIVANASAVSGSVNSLQIIDSGFGYFNAETISFGNEDVSSSIGTGSIVLDKHGFSQGYYKRNDSVLSGNKYLTDGNYYQNFSYEIRSAVTLDRYADMLKDIMHISGMKYFSKFVSESILEDTSNIKTELTING